jgi:hypothetical protein
MRNAVKRVLDATGRLFQAAARLPRRVHQDQCGTMSLISVATLLLMVVLMGMVINTGQQVDQKIRLQNAADAATYSGGVVMTRSMNSLAFTNHLLSETFALTAFMREAKARRAESLTPEMLDNWERIGKFMFSPSHFTKFKELGWAISEKIPPNRVIDGDREMIFAFSEWAAAGSELMLPVFEGILYERLIPRFQVALVETTPRMVQLAADRTAEHHGQTWPTPVALRAVLWRTVVDPVGGGSEAMRGTLPVVDPLGGTELNMPHYFNRAKSTRDNLALNYLNQWNNAVLKHFDYLGKMSQFSNLWRIFTRGELESLLDREYPASNLPHVLRTREPGRDELDQDYMFVGVVYRAKRADMMRLVFRNPMASDTTAFSQMMLFVPQRRLVWAHYTDRFTPPGGISGGGIPGMTNPFPVTDPDPTPSPPGNSYWQVVLQSGGWHGDTWSLFNQNWSAQLTPATNERIHLILSADPYVLGAHGMQLPSLSGLDPQDVRWLTHH